jgi:hypothetical protein
MSAGSWSDGQPAQWGSSLTQFPQRQVPIAAVSLGVPWTDRRDDTSMGMCNCAMSQPAPTGGHDIGTNGEDLRLEAARLACALIRFEDVAAHPSRGATPPGAPRVGTEAYVFQPSWVTVPRDEVATFLVGLPSPALLSHTTTRGVLALTLLHELSGDRRRWAEKTLSNYAAGLEELGPQLGLSPASRILLEFDEESLVFSFAAVRELTQQFAVGVGWSIERLERDDRADACMVLLRSDGKRFQGRSCMLPPGWWSREPESGATPS